MLNELVSYKSVVKDLVKQDQRREKSTRFFYFFLFFYLYIYIMWYDSMLMFTGESSYKKIGLANWPKNKYELIKGANTSHKYELIGIKIWV